MSRTVEKRQLNLQDIKLVFFTTVQHFDPDGTQDQIHKFFTIYSVLFSQA